MSLLHVWHIPQFIMKKRTQRNQQSRSSAHAKAQPTRNLSESKSVVVVAQWLDESGERGSSSLKRLNCKSCSCHLILIIIRWMGAYMG